MMVRRFSSPDEYAGFGALVSTAQMAGWSTRSLKTGSEGSGGIKQ
jgi:hypothetical protein